MLKRRMVKGEVAARLQVRDKALNAEIPSNEVLAREVIPCRKPIAKGQLLIGRKWREAASGIQTGDLKRALGLADRIKAGTVWLNTWHQYHPNAPFGSFKMSGFGREQGAEALEN